jgi:uncharacterized membrane protein
MTLWVFCVVMLAATLHAWWNFVAKKVSGNLSALWLGLCLASLLSFPFAVGFSRSEQLTLDALPYVMATGILHAFYFGLLAKAYELGDISLVYPLSRGTGVAGTALLAAVVLQERISLCGAIGIGTIGMGTVILGLRSGGHQEGLAGYLHALLVGVVIVGYSTVDKVGVGYLHPVIYISGLFWLATVFLAPYVLLCKRQECLYAYQHLKASICVIGLGSIATYLLILWMFQYGKVSYIVAAREFAVVIGALLGVLLLKERFTRKKVLGVTAIVIGLVLVKIA